MVNSAATLLSLFEAQVARNRDAVSRTDRGRDIDGTECCGCFDLNGPESDTGIPDGAR